MNNKILILATASLLLSGCVPAAIGGAAVVGGAMTTEKGLSGSMTDTRIATEIKMKMYQKDPDMHARVNATVQGGEVMLTGAVPNKSMHDEAVKTTWEVSGVTRVIDNIGMSQGISVTECAKDTWVTTQVKSNLLTHQDIHSLNYSVKTVGGVVYLMGYAPNQTEMDRVTEVASKTDGVKRVVSYIKVRD